MIEIEIPQSVVRDAMVYDDIVESKVSGRPNYTNLSQSRRYMIGYLGEYAFNQWLKENGIDYDWIPKSNGFSEDADFIINGWKIDIKSTAYNKAHVMMMPEKQKIHKRDFYVGAHFSYDDNTVRLMGYIESDLFVNSPSKDWGHNVPTKSWLYKDLKPLISLKNIIKNQK